eukprot:jgi/Tetstr1/429169/TSEL_019122.t1
MSAPPTSSTVSWQRSRTSASGSASRLRQRHMHQRPSRGRQRSATPTATKARKEKDKAARKRREQQRREADAKNRDKNCGKTGDKTRERRFNQGVWCNDATPAQLKFLTAEPRRFTTAGAWEKSSDYVFSFDLQDGVYALGIAPSDRDYFTVNIRGTLYRLCGLPMGWSLSPYYFTTFMMTFVKHLRSPTTPAAPGNVPRSRRWLRRGRWRGARIFPYVDDFLMFASSSEPETLELRQRVADLLDNLGLLRNPATCAANSRPIHRHVETAYMHCDSSGYGWGAVLNGRLEARRFLGATDERQHITWKELKAVRLAVESFLPHLAGRRVLLHEDN